MYQLEYFAVTHPGKVRSGNEDNFYVDGLWKKELEQAECLAHGMEEKQHFLAAVCDGMGGEEFGEIAALLAVESLNVKNFEPKAYVEIANEKICQEMKKRDKSMGSTASILEFQGNKVRAVNLGDSRIYRYRNDKLEQLSTDHTVIARMLRIGQITRDEIDGHPMQHKITQYLGIEPEEMVLEPAVTEWMGIQERDVFLLCSDGLTDMLMDEEIKAVLEAYEELGDCGAHLFEKALAAGGIDNVTVVLVKAGKCVRWWKGLF